MKREPVPPEARPLEACFDGAGEADPDAAALALDRFARTLQRIADRLAAERQDERQDDAADDAA